jgi:hypothetical protein
MEPGTLRVSSNEVAGHTRVLPGVVMAGLLSRPTMNIASANERHVKIAPMGIVPFR